MSIDTPDCPDCLKLMVEDVARYASDPENLALLQSRKPQEAKQFRDYLRQILGRPDDTLEQLTRILARKAKAKVGSYEN